MKIVDYDTFVKLPTGTVYSNYEPYVFNNFLVKLNVLKDETGFVTDWFYSELCCNPSLEHSEDYDIESTCGLLEITSVPIDLYTQQRDGMFDYNRKFLIYEEKDLIKLTEHLMFLTRLYNEK